MAGYGVWPARMLRGLLVLALPVAGCSAGGSAPIGSARPQRSGPATAALAPKYLTSLGPAAVVSASDAWVAGSLGGRWAAMEHWDGARWSRLRDPVFAGWNINSMAAGSARDIWAVGYLRHPTQQDPSQTTLLIAHFDGAAWQRVRAPTLPGDTTLAAVTVVSARDAWAVGSLGIRRSTWPLILHWDGSAWSRVAAHGPPGGYLTDVAGVSAGDVWAVGNRVGRTLTEHWDGTAWRPVPSPDPSRFDDFLSAVAVVSPRDAWAVGGAGNRVGRVRTLVMHWDGAAWQIVPSPRRPGGRLLSVAAGSGKDLWAVGRYTRRPQCLILHWDGRAWTPSPATAPSACSLRTVATVKGGGAWAIGTWARPPTYRQHGLILLWNGKTWT